MRDMGHEDKEKDDDNNNTINNDDDDDDHVPQQQHTITCGHTRTRGGRSRRIRGQQSPTNLVQQHERPRYLEDLVVGHHLIINFFC